MPIKIMTNPATRPMPTPHSKIVVLHKEDRVGIMGKMEEAVKEAYE